MTKFSEFSSLLAENTSDNAVSFFRNNESEILREYRCFTEDDNYNEYLEHDHKVFDVVRVDTDEYDRNEQFVRNDTIRRSTLDDNMKCPECAEIILREAKKCRFCGKEITKADRLGYPSFYSNILSMGFSSPGVVLLDYAEHYAPDDSGQLNTDKLVASLLSWGDLNEYDLIQNIRKKLFARAWDVAAGMNITGPEAIESSFASIENEELKAVYLSARYMSVCSQFGKKWDGVDPRTELRSLQFALDTLKELRGLAESANPPMRGFVYQFDEEMQTVSEELAKMQSRQDAIQTEVRNANRADVASTPNFQSHHAKPVNKGLVLAALVVVAIIFAVIMVMA